MTETPIHPPPAALRKLLIANRGEIAVRVARTARDMGMDTVVLFSEDDRHSDHLRFADTAHPLQGAGAGAYLDGEQIIAAARRLGCDAVHPGYGFLSENSDFAHRCQQAGLVFVGPAPQTIALFGDKTRARALARQCGVAVNPGSDGAVSVDGAKAFFDALPPGGAMVIKALAGGGGKGMRIVRRAGELENAFARCQSEARRAFGRDALYVERLVQRARHIEVQVAGDGHQVSHLWERECTLQRQHQKLVEFAPAIDLGDSQRQYVLDAAIAMAEASHFSNLGTFEFLLDLDRAGEPDEIVFLEANPRLQVEHTVTEAVLGLDLVAIQLALATGQRLADLCLTQQHVPRPRGRAVQLRINMETMDDSGRALPATGTLSHFSPPGGPGIRVDTFAYAGYTAVAGFDSLLAKLVVNHPGNDVSALLSRARRAAAEFAIEGVPTNLRFLENLLAHPALAINQVTTDFVARHIAELVPAAGSAEPVETPAENLLDGDELTVVAPLSGILVDCAAAEGDTVQAGAVLALIEAMKLEHEVNAPAAGRVSRCLVQPGDSVQQGQTLLTVIRDENAATGAAANEAVDPALIRDDLRLVQERIAETLDAQRPTAVERRRQRGQRTARENISQLCDDGSFVEYGQLAVAYLHSRKSHDELRTTTPADGFVTGLATVNAAVFGDAASQVAVASYDATVMAGTQGHKNHQKADRLFDVAGERQLPLVLFAEGGGGRPREDPVTIAALENTNFHKLARLSGRVPVIGIVSGRCFAGNAALLGMADVIIAAENSNIGMGGPALIEAGGLGTFTPEDVGPIEVQHQNGVVDIRVEDELGAVTAAQRYLSYFQGTLPEWKAHDSRLLRHAVPENRLRAYDVAEVIRLLADVDSVLELRSGYGRACVTALIRVEGRPLGVIANNPGFNAGAVDSDSADKAARFMRLCDAHGLPILSLIDTPGIMVGPDAEKTALVRHASRLFVTAASLQVPLFAIVLRKAYGLGAAAAAGGHFKAPFFTVAWPTGELGGMGLEGGVRLAYKKEMEAIEDADERQAFFQQRVASRYRKGKAVHIASYFELDAVIDPADSRQWIRRGLDATAATTSANRGRFIDTW